MAQTQAGDTTANQTVTHAVAMAAQERRFNLNKVLVVVVLYLAAFWTLVPMYWVAITSVKSMRRPGPHSAALLSRPTYALTLG